MAEQNYYPPEYYAQDRQLILLAVIQVLAVLSTSVTAARLYMQFRLVKSPGLDKAVVGFSTLRYSWLTF